MIGLGVWEGDTYKLPSFYFKDKNTLAFPYETKSNDEGENDFARTNGFRKSGAVPLRKRNWHNFI